MLKSVGTPLPIPKDHQIFRGLSKGKGDLPGPITLFCVCFYFLKTNVWVSPVPPIRLPTKTKTEGWVPSSLHIRQEDAADNCPGLPPYQTG